MLANNSPKELMQGILDASLTAIVVLKALRNQENKIVDFTWQLFNQRAIDIYPSLNGVIEVGKRVSELFPSIFGNENFQRWVYTTQTGEPYQIEYHYSQDGFNNWFRERGVRFGDGLIISSDDITEQKEKEATLLRSGALLLESQQIAQIGTFQLNEQGEIYWTEQMYQIFEIDPSVKLTTTLIDNLIHEEDRERFLDNVNKVFSSEQSHTVEYKLCLPNGKLKHIWSRAKMVNGKFTGTAMDITERKELELTNTRLAHRNVDLDSFVFTASHDLRAPINHIESLLNFLQEEIKGQQEGVALYMELLHKSIVDLQTTLQDLTTVTEIHSGEKAEHINLVDVIEEVKVAHHKLIQETNASIQVGLGVAFLPIPKRHAKSLVYNLFSNALKFRSKDRPLIIRICSNLKQNKIHLSFSDNGIGIKKEDQDKVFMIFKRFNPEIAGRGVGMYLVKRIIDLNEGEIYLESQENAGTTFHIEFPVSE
ncbi:ATP-binding protein [Rhodocytophaga aerolata]|uniref:histidine kinase n=1 Tax=Rhodocytophaga aerolata TaxID=455078 RepID=A0ABT8QZW2_9BACT|nr:sensor histidine kinase [Rhodocytophaga aerolata]MDO1444684.1 ATP-binding protein [Rhodocytophaga aerolata]